MVFNGEQNSNIPWGGDTLYIYTKKGLSVYDTIRVHGLTVDVSETPYAPVIIFTITKLPETRLTPALK